MGADETVGHLFVRIQHTRLIMAGQLAKHSTVPSTTYMKTTTTSQTARRIVRTDEDNTHADDDVDDDDVVEHPTQRGAAFAAACGLTPLEAAQTMYGLTKSRARDNQQMYRNLDQQDTVAL